MPRQPTDEEYHAYDGMHCNQIWKQLDDYWECPVCNRNKRQILVWGKRKGSNARRYGEIGFKTGIHSHHDHSRHNRFPYTHICGSCNFLDARLKREIKAVDNFSFSPLEMNQCVSNVGPNTGIKRENIDFSLARRIYTLLLGQYGSF